MDKQDKLLSKALEINLADSRVCVTIDEKYETLLLVMQRYSGVTTGLRSFLEEICHPYKNWAFIAKEGKKYALNYFHVLKTHSKGPEAASVYVDIFFEVVEEARDQETRIAAADVLLLFFQKMIREAGDDFGRFQSVLKNGFERIYTSDPIVFELFATSFYPLDRLGELILKAPADSELTEALDALLGRFYRFTYDYWLKQADPESWLEEETRYSKQKDKVRSIFKPLSHDNIRKCLHSLEAISLDSQLDSREKLQHLIQLPGYRWIVARYGEVPHELLLAAGENGMGHYLKLVFLLHLMEIAGLSTIHEETLRDINRTMIRLMEREGPSGIRHALVRTFAILKKSMARFPGTALHCVLNMGQGVYDTGDSDLVAFFIESVVSLGFQTPGPTRVGNDWQVKINPVHIQNIRTWLQLVELKPKWSKTLLSSLTIHLSTGGILIKDTDLFPRDITRLLNSEIEPVYNLVKQLARLFPAYYNDVGAEGRLRDISSRIDDICLRKDPLIHFLRKQSHVESSNRIIDLMEATLHFWRTRDKNVLRPYLPPGIFGQVEVSGPYVDGVNRILEDLFPNHADQSVASLLQTKDAKITEMVRDVKGTNNVDQERVVLAIAYYKLLYQKYHLDIADMETRISQIQVAGLPEPEKLRSAMAEKKLEEKIFKLLGYLEQLKETILSPEIFEAREDIYRKRHFTMDIPSMYGSYHETKFDALGLSLRIESLLNPLFEELVANLDLGLITRATLSLILDYFRLFNWALKLDGIVSHAMERHMDFLAHALQTRGFSSTQYIDIFRGISRILTNIINDYFNNMHQGNIVKIVGKLSSEDLAPKFRATPEEEDEGKLVDRVTEIFLRERLSSSLGLQQLDHLLTRILTTLHSQNEDVVGERLQLLLSYDPDKAVTPLRSPEGALKNIIHMGNKALNLVKIKGYGLPVPEGFIITTEVFRCREIVEAYPPARANFEDQLHRETVKLERVTGKTFGDARNPLLLSVRSGSAISQPGMMNTLVNVGINERVIEGLIAQTDNEWFGWDTYRRFLQSYGMAHGLERDDFDAIMARFKEKLGIPLKRGFSGQQMRSVTRDYLDLLEDNGLQVNPEPFEQLRVAIGKVFASWFSPKADAYRKIMGISEDWGTAVTVQEMIFGNCSSSSGSGVFFTHNPGWSGDMLIPWGDFTPGNQGEDVVSGLVTTHPISVVQAESEKRDPSLSLETLFPEIYRSLRDWSKKLIYERKWSPQEMEFTFDGAKRQDLYFLQTRDMNIRERKTTHSFEVDPGSSLPTLGHGIGVSGGAMTGRVVFSLEEIKAWRQSEPKTSLILLRSDTVPDDIQEIFEADGLLTGRGGSTSHAAIVAHRLGKTCIVGFAKLTCLEKEKVCKIGDHKLGSGDLISMDGGKGAVYFGKMKIRQREGVKMT